MTDYIKGIDVSIIQGSIDWSVVAAAGIQFAIMRAGVGNGGIDKNYSTNIKNAKAAGLKVMAYNFVYPLPPLASQPLRDPIKQANYHYSACEGELAACDFEWPSTQDWGKWSCNAKQINDWGLAYLAEYSRLDKRKMILYTYPYFAQAVNFTQEYSQYPLWIASYQSAPSIPAVWKDVGWALWQNSGGTSKLPGTNIPVDTDLAKDLSLWDPPAINVSPTSDPNNVVITPQPPAVVTPPVAPPADPVVSVFTNIWNNVSKLIKK